MSGDDYRRALACHSAIREGRRWLDQQLSAHVAQHFPGNPSLKNNQRDHEKEKAASLVRGEMAYHVAEFFYVARALGLLHEGRLMKLVDRHNADMAALLENPAEAFSMGLTPERVRDAMFSLQQQQKIRETKEQDMEGRPVLDQSDLIKLLAPLMSPESCRQILVTMGKGGLLTSWKWSGRSFVTSPGVLEDYFHRHLLFIDQAWREAP